MKHIVLAVMLFGAAPALAQQLKIPYITPVTPTNAKVFNGLEPVEPINDLVEYFGEIALGSQLGGASAYLRRWQQPLRFVILGEDSPELAAELAHTITELQAMLPQLRFEPVAEREQANFVVFFGRSDDYASTIEPAFAPYASANSSGFWLRWQASHICNGSLYIDTTRIPEITDQRYLLRTMLTRSLGMMQLSPRYDNTVFYSQWQPRLAYSQLDRQMLFWQYHPALHPGLDRNDLTKRLNEVFLSGHSATFFATVWQKTFVRPNIGPENACAVAQ
jgi:hypothetical protein